MAMIKDNVSLGEMKPVHRKNIRTLNLPAGQFVINIKDPTCT